MPGKLKAKIVAGRHLPVMDRASELTDAFVEVSATFGAKLLYHCLCSTETHMHGAFLFTGEVWKYNF